MNPSSNRMKHEILTASEMAVLDMLANGLLVVENLPDHLDSVCQLLRNHAFARVRNITAHGRNSYQAWDITDEGQTYLIKHYKKQIGHV